MSAGTERILAAIAASGLAGVHPSLPEVALGQADWRAVLDGVAVQRLAGLLARAIAGGHFAVTDDQAAEAARLEVKWASQALALERVLIGVSERLDRAGLDHLVLKGPAFAHRLYPDPNLRSFADIDLLVPGGSFDDALATLVARGGRRRYDEPRPGFTARFGKGASVVTPGGYEIDVHRSFVAGPLGQRIDLASLFASAVPFTLADHPMRQLAPEEGFLHACYHAMLGSATPRLVPQRDLAEFVLGMGLDVDRVLRLARAWHGQAVVARAVALAWSTFALPHDHQLAAWALAYRPSPAEERAMAVSAGSGRSYEGEAVATVSAISGTRNKAAYLRAVLFPDRDYLRRREGSYRARLGHGLRLARQLRDRR